MSEYKDSEIQELLMSIGREIIDDKEINLRFRNRIIELKNFVAQEYMTAFGKILQRPVLDPIVIQAWELDEKYIFQDMNVLIFLNESDMEEYCFHAQRLDTDDPRIEIRFYTGFTDNKARPMTTLFEILENKRWFETHSQYKASMYYMSSFISDIFRSMSRRVVIGGKRNSPDSFVTVSASHLFDDLIKRYLDSVSSCEQEGLICARYKVGEEDPQNLETVNVYLFYDEMKGFSMKVIEADEFLITEDMDENRHADTRLAIRHDEYSFVSEQVYSVIA